MSTPQDQPTDAPRPADAPQPAGGPAGGPPAPPTAPPAAPPAPPAASPALPAAPPPVLPAPPPPPAPKAPLPHRRWVRVTARWTVAAVLCLGVGTAVAKVIADRERTDVPGLATEEDGRWAYPELELPALPAGARAPFTDGNPDGYHHADLRALLLPAPDGGRYATGDGEGGVWLPAEDFLDLFADSTRKRLAAELDAVPLRHIATRGWEMPDGTATDVYLMRFSTPEVADSFMLNHLGSRGNRVELAGAEGLQPDEAWPKEGNRLGGVRVTVKAEPPGGADGQARVAFLRSGDTIGLVVQTHPDDSAEVPFHQTVILQSQLLG